MRVRRISLLLTFVALVAFISGLALAQLNDGTAQIDVSSCGQALPGATVKIDVAGTPRASVANAQGMAQFDALPVGAYTASAELDGYAPNSGPITVKAGEVAKTTITLQPAVCEEGETQENCCQKMRKREKKDR